MKHWLAALTTDIDRIDRALWFLTLLGLAIRIAAVLVLNDYQHPLTAEYGIVAEHLVAGKGFVGGGWLGPEQPTALNTPIYPLFLAAWLWSGVPLPFLGVELSQAVLSALIIYLSGRIALYLLDASASLIAALMITFYPPLIYFCKQVSPAIFTTFFTILACAALLWFLKTPSWAKAIGLGIIWGVALLVEPILLLALPGLTLILWVGWKQTHRSGVLAKLTITALVCLMVLTPWTVRNYLVFERIIPFKTSFGLNFWLGNNPNATGFLYTATGEPMANTIPPERLAYLSALNEAERYAVLQREAWEWIQANPDQFLRLTAQRIGYLWLISPTHQITSEHIVEPRWFYTLRTVIQAGLLIAALAGAIVAFGRYRLWLIASIWLVTALTFPYVISVAGNTRYRLPVEPILLILAAVAVTAVIDRLRLVGDSAREGTVSSAQTDSRSAQRRGRST